MQSYKCQFHPNLDSVGSCPKCHKHVCAICLPYTDRPCRACVGYRQAQTLAAAAATTVSIFIGMINPLFGLVGVVILFFSFRAIFRRRTRTILGITGLSATEPTASPAQPSQSNISNLNFCNNCRLWTGDSYCKQCGKKLI